MIVAKLCLSEDYHSQRDRNTWYSSHGISCWYIFNALGFGECSTEVTVLVVLHKCIKDINEAMPMDCVSMKRVNNCQISWLMNSIMKLDSGRQLEMFHLCDQRINQIESRSINVSEKKPFALLQWFMLDIFALKRTITVVYTLQFTQTQIKTHVETRMGTNACTHSIIS